MAVTIDVTPGGAASNAYITNQEADDYHDARLHNAAWASATEEDQDRAIVWATRLLDTLSFVGCPASSAQALHWPADVDANSCGHTIGNTVIPSQVKEATAEFAFWLLQRDFTSASATAASQGPVSKLKAGPLEVNYAVASATATSADIFPDIVYQLLDGLLESSGDWGSLRWSRA